MNTSRRNFLKQAGTIGACTCCLGATSLFASCGASKAISGTETSDMVSLPISSLNSSGYATVTTKKFSDPVFVSKQPDETYKAMLLHCPHKGGPLKLEGDKFICGWHKSEFATNGDLLKGPATTGLKQLKVTTDKDMLNVHFN